LAASRTNTPWDALWAMNPLSAALTGPPSAPGAGVAGRTPHAVLDPVAVATAGLETWRWLVNAQIDLAVATLSALRR
jgi:hypothetical protein